MNKALKQAMIEQHRKRAVISKHRQQTQPLATESDQSVSFVLTQPKELTESQIMIK
jgi:hypothetical protein